MMTSYSKIRLQVSVLRTNGPLVRGYWDICVFYFGVWDIQEFWDMGYWNLFWDTS